MCGKSAVRSFESGNPYPGEGTLFTAFPSNVTLALSETLLPSLVARAMLNRSISRESNSLCGFPTASYSLRISFTGNFEQIMTLAASWKHGNVTKLESHPSVTKTPRGWGAEFSFSRSGTVNSQTFATDVATAASSHVLWLPVVLLLTLWIKLTSPGPVVFRQERVGYCGKRFMILKFRTMKRNVETRTHNVIANIKLSLPTKHGSQCRGS
jgi:Bacterial sugar transferase